MKKHCIAMLLAGGQGSRLYALTAKVAKPSIPFGGKYRIIDFPLSNCANSGIDTVGVLTQYQPLLLNRYIGTGQAWDLDSIDGGVYILPPYQSAGERGSWFSGTANAIYQNMDFIEMYDPDCVLILSADRPVRTKERADVSTYYGEHAHVENCLVADGCFIEGTVTDCILSRCIVMQDTCIAADAILQYVIADKNVRIGPAVTLTGCEALPIVIPKGSEL